MNADIRMEAWKRDVKFYEIANALGIREATFSVKMRKEMSMAEKEKILKIIADIAEARSHV